MLKIGLQLWSVKEAAQEDLLHTLERVSKMGYEGVEFAGYYGYSAQTIKDKLDELGLNVAGSHIPLEKLQTQLDEVIEFEQVIGNQYVVCPYAYFDTEQQWRDFFKELAHIGRKLGEAGLTLVYHNHHHEFELIDGKTILDEMVNSVAYEDLKVELDTYWSDYASVVRTTSWMRNKRNRLPLIHLKDMKAECKESTEIGRGILPVESYVKVAKEVGTQWLIVEQESFTKDPLECIELSLNNLKEMI